MVEPAGAPTADPTNAWANPMLTAEVHPIHVSRF